MSLGKNLKLLREAKGLDQKQLAKMSGVPSGTISALEVRESKKSDFAPQLAQALGVSLAELLGAEAPTHTPPALIGKPVRALAEGEDPGEGYVQIPEYEVRFAAGNGRTALFDEIEGTKPRTYRVEWFVEAGINPANVKCFKVHGDSMEPMLFDGDSVLVNLAETSIINGKVYAMRYGDELRIKRCYKRLDGGLVLHSDNPGFLPRDEDVSPAMAAEHITILGRVRDKSGSGGL